MNSQASPTLLLLFFMCLIPLPLSYGDVLGGYTSCGNQFDCGNITGVDFPFWGQDQRPYGCGYPGLELICNNGVTTIEIMSVKYRVLDINPNSQILKIAREDYLGGICRPQFVNTTLDSTLFDFVPDYANLTIFYGCPTVSNMGFINFSCAMNGFPYDGVFVTLGEVEGPRSCNTSVIVPVFQMGWGVPDSLSGLDQLLWEGFEVKWKVDSKACSDCTGSNGVCGYLNRTTCYCPSETSGPATCHSSPAAVASWASPPTPGT